VRRSIFVAWVWCFFAVSVMADQVTLKNGDRLTGTIVKSDAKTLLIKTEFAGDVSVQWEAVSGIVSTQTLHLALKDGQTIVGMVNTTENKFEVATKETGPVSASKDAVTAVRNDAEEKAYVEQVERLRHPHLTDFWSGLLDTGLSDTRGNSESLTFSMAAKAARVTDSDKITAYTSVIYSKSLVNGVTSTTAHDIRGGVRGDLNVSAKTFVFAFTDLEYDAFQHLDLRNVLGGGFGYHAIKTKNTSFDIFGGGSFDQEYFAAYSLVTTNPTPPPPTITTTVASNTRKSGEAVIGETFNSKINGRTTLSETFSLFPNVSITGNYRMQFDISAATKLKNWLGWQISYSDRYITNPPTGLKGNDQLLSTGLRLTFGKGTF
jgi:putative salt-induced outer membrane protein YdiY